MVAKLVDSVPKIAKGDDIAMGVHEVNVVNRAPA